MRTAILLVWVVLAALCVPRQGWAQEDRLRALERRIARLEGQKSGFVKVLDDLKGILFTVGTALATGAFCAAWARSTGRDPWVWLTAGILFNVFTLLAILSISSKDEEDKKRLKATEPEL